MFKNFFNKVLSAFNSEHKREYFSCAIHNYERTVVQTPPPSWNNIHAYETYKCYWAAVDMRSWGIRVQDIIVKCDSVEKQVYWRELMTKSAKIIDTIKCRDNYKTGKEINTEFVFHCTDGSTKSYNMTGSGDLYLEDFD